MPTISNRVGSVIGGHWSTRQNPTATQRMNVEIAQRDFAVLEMELIDLVDEHLLQLEEALADAGAPWTPGGLIRPSGRPTRPRMFLPRLRPGEALVTVRWRNVRIQEFKLDRLKEVVEMGSDWEAVDEAINRVLFTEEIRSMLDETDDEPLSTADDDMGLPWDA